MTRERKVIILGVSLFTVIVIGLFFYGRIGQAADYHHFAEVRTLVGIPNGWNVVSNLAFWYAAWYGLMCLLILRGKQSPIDGNGALILLTIGSALTGIGSAYYHAFPSSETLVWDRIPMTICFAAIFTEFIALSVSTKYAKLSLIPTLTLCVGTVLYWKWTGLTGADDLRPYVMVQFFPLLLIPLTALLFPRKGVCSSAWTRAIIWYATAKILEYADVTIFTGTDGTVSGHTLKHIASGVAVFYALRAMLERRYT